MADFFGKLKQTIAKSTEVITTKSSSVIDTTRVKTEIGNLNKTKGELFSKIGKKVYEADQLTFTLDLVNDELIALAKCDADIEIKQQELERIRLEADEKLSQINQNYNNSGLVTPAEVTTEAAVAPQTTNHVQSDEDYIADEDLYVSEAAESGDDNE